MIDLRQTTFIIPVFIESDDRKKNVEITLSYLCKHLETNIIVLEYGDTQVAKEIVKTINKHKTAIRYIFHKKTPEGKVFHRTRFLNLMLSKVQTPVTVNYDGDVLLTPETYKKSQDLILSGQDLVFPYFWGDSQCQINYSGRDKIMKSLMLAGLHPSEYTTCRSEYGQCQFFNTKSYIAGGMEHEGFVSWAPEDQERAYRFKRLGYNVVWSDGYIYHLEHTRGINSSSNNPMMQHNNELFDSIQKLSTEELKEYYKNQEYLKKYKK